MRREERFVSFRIQGSFSKTGSKVRANPTIERLDEVAPGGKARPASTPRCGYPAWLVAEYMRGACGLLSSYPLPQPE
jgi:hypothetical protein